MPWRPVRFVSMSLLAAALVASFPAPALASHAPRVIHQPPPAAQAGQNLHLVGAIEGCWLFCSPITLTVRYWNALGPRHRQTVNLGSFPQLQPAHVVIPGAHVEPGVFRYRMIARQASCWFDACHDGITRTPATGSYEVSVP